MYACSLSRAPARQRRDGAAGLARAERGRRRCRAAVVTRVAPLVAAAPAPGDERTTPSPRFKCTSSNAIAAGVMPEMRAAWPIVSGLCRLSLCCDLGREAAHRAVIEIERQARGSPAPRAARSLPAAGRCSPRTWSRPRPARRRSGPRPRRPRRAASSATRTSRPAGAGAPASVYSRSIGCPSTRSASCARHDRGIHRRALEALLLERDRVALARERIPARIVDHAELAAALGETQIRVVLAQLQPVFRARREHPIRLGDAARDEIVDEHAEIRFVAARRPAALAAHEARGVDAGEKALRRGFLVARRAVDLAREEEAADRLGFERRLRARADRSNRIRSNSRAAGCARARSP